MKIIKKMLGFWKSMILNVLTKSDRSKLLNPNFKLKDSLPNSLLIKKDL